MPSCPGCGAQVADDVHFCDTCGTALQWDGDPGFQPFGPTAPAPPPPRAPAEREPSAVVGGGPVAGREPSPAMPAPPAAAPSRFGVTLDLSQHEVAVEPGGTTSLEARVRNRGDVVDEFTLWVDGPPGSWVRVEPPRVAVYPGQEGTAALTFEPPRDAGIPAGRTPFRLVARSVQQGGAAAVQDGVVDIAPVTGLDLDVRPERVQTDRLATYEVVLTNRSNHDVVVDLEVREPQFVLQTQLDPVQLQAPAFGTAVATLQAAAPGEAPDTPRPFPITVHAALADRPLDAPVTADAVLVHKFSPPAAYLATLLGWLIGGLLAGLVLGGTWLVLEWVLGIPVGAFVGPALPVGVIIVGVTLASALLARRAVRMRRGLRDRRTAWLLLLLTPLWAVGLVLSVVAALDRGSSAGLLGIAALFAVVNPALVGRWIALRGTQEPVLPRPGRRTPPAPRPATFAPSIPAQGPRPTPVQQMPAPPSPPPLQPPSSFPGPAAPVSGGPPLRAAPERAPSRRGSPASAAPAPGRSAGLRSPKVLGLVAGGLLVVGVGGAALAYQFLPVPGTVVGGVNVRFTPDTRFAPAAQIPDGQRVTISCQVNGFGQVNSPPQLQGGFVFLEAVDTYWPPRSC